MKVITGYLLDRETGVGISGKTVSFEKLNGDPITTATTYAQSVSSTTDANGRFSGWFELSPGPVNVQRPGEGCSCLAGRGYQGIPERTGRDIRGWPQHLDCDRWGCRRGRYLHHRERGNGHRRNGQQQRCVEPETRPGDPPAVQTDSGGSGQGPAGSCHHPRLYIQRGPSSTHPCRLH